LAIKFYFWVTCISVFKVVFLALDKSKLRKKFASEWEKHYKLDFLLKEGFVRRTCRKCGINFWTLDPDRDVCGDAACVGYEFLGNPPTKKRLDYIETWKTFENFFEKRGHKSISRYPVICRWRNDLFFTMASIQAFQPYVTSGEVDPPGNPLIIPQPCLRFNDIPNVGVSGRHLTCFTMIGQHAFNKDKLFYWKEEALGNDYDYLQKGLGIKKEEIVFHEEVWAGGGNFGPCIEFFVQGNEIGNCVFMQFEETDSGYREMDIKVVDMGSGWERQAWIVSEEPNVYEIAFKPVVDYLKKQTGAKVDKKLFLDYSKVAGSLNADETDLVKARIGIAEQLGVDKTQLFDEIAPLEAVYAISDHTKSLLFAVTDGQLPSNSGGGYNLRLIARRALGFVQEYGFDFDFEKVLELHASFLKPVYPGLDNGVETTALVIEEEKKKYLETMRRGRGKVVSLLRKTKGKIPREKLLELYESDGVSIEMVEEIATEEKISVETPPDFYMKVAEKHLGKKEKKERKVDISGIEKTKILFYGDSYKKEFSAKVLKVIGNFVVLDKTLFYPEGGGQPGDAGTISGSKVLDVQKENGVVLHKVSKPADFSAGQKVRGEIDWKRRQDLMLAHTGAHILGAACRKVLGKHVWQSGSQNDVGSSRIDFSHFRHLTWEQINEIELEANNLIRSAIPVESRFMLKNVAEEKYGFVLYQVAAIPGREIRVVSIGEADHQACGGTHVKNTSELGLLKIIGSERIADNVERLEFAVGQQALKLMQKKEQSLRNAAENLGVPEKELVNASKKFFDEWKSQKKQIESLKSNIASRIVENLVSASQKKEGLQWIFLEVKDVDSLTLQLVAADLAKKEKSVVAVLLGGSEKNRSVFVFGSAGKKAVEKGVDVSKYVAKVAKAAGGKGGGRPDFARGGGSDMKSARKALEDVFR